MPIPHALQFHGTLDDVPLDELIGLAASAGVTGMIELGGGNVGRIFFHDGQLQHAETAEAHGFDALCQLFDVRQASFCFVSGVASTTVTLQHNTHTLADLAKQHAEQWRHVRSHIQDMNLVPTLRDRVQAPKVHISEATWPIVAAVDGQRSITELAVATARPPLEVCLALCELLLQGVVTFAPRTTVLPPTRIHRIHAKPSLFKRVPHAR